jgi:predicted transcriptional regulator
VTIDDELLAEVKVLAARGNRTLGSVVEEALRELLARHGAVAAVPRPTLPVSGAGGLVPGVELTNRDQLAALLGDEDPA